MAIKKAYTVTDLGGGDGGKGGVVHKLCALRKPHTVIKVGGAQGSHGVRTAAGERFNFSQFGCGTFNGARTYISDRFVVSPIGLLNEASALRYEQGVNDPFGLLTVDGDALCTTPYHGLASRLRELARMNHPRGTVGVGVGEAYVDREMRPELTLFAKDLTRGDLGAILSRVRAQKLHDLDPVLSMDFLESDKEEAEKQIALLYDDKFLEWTIAQFQEVARRVRIVDGDFLRREIFGRDGVVVFESSHGVLTDRYFGFHPHTSRLRTLPDITTWSLLDEHGYDGQVIKLGVTRAYQIRHGAGPLVTDDAQTAAELTKEEVGTPDRYRGEIRVGPLDCVALRYALRVCGGPQTFDGLAVTWFDHAARALSWRICERYVDADDSTYFTPSGEMSVHRGLGIEQLLHQEGFTRALQRCRPDYRTYAIAPGASQKDMIELCSGVLREQLGTPVRMIAFGPTEDDKICC